MINPPEGFFYFPAFLNTREQKRLLVKILLLPWQAVKMHGIIAKRRVVHFGLDYSYTRKNVKPTTPAPAYLRESIEKAARLMSISPEDIAEILITEYPTGAGIGWHKDAAIFGEKVFGFSLGSVGVMKFRIKRGDKYEIYKIELIPGSAYIISGVARYQWQHSVSAVKAPRYSITFRTL